MAVYNTGPFIPGLPKKPTPSKPAAKPSPTYDAFKYLPAASKPKAPSTGGPFIPELATDAQRARLSPAVLGQAPKAPRPSRPSTTTTKKSDLGTGSIETKTAPPPSGGGSGDTTEAAASKPIGVTLDQEGIDAAQAAADALRNFQKTQANLQLQQALAKIDRAAIEQYKGISEDYAARGLARSGAKLQKEQQAVDERDRATDEAKQAVTDFLDELRLTGNLEQASANLGKSKAFQDYITGRLSPAMGE